MLNYIKLFGENDTATMPEISLNLLKEKIIKTDTVIRLLVEKNEKIVQLREKLKMLYHKYVNKVKECEVLQVEIDLCKIEHQPLVANIKDLTNTYESLMKEHQSLINTSEVKYQSKCKELELQKKKYNDLLQKEEICNACVDTNVKYESLLRNHSKLTKRLETLNSKQKDDQQTIQDLQNDINKIKGSYCNQINILKQNNIGEITKLEEVITAFKLSESKLKEEILNITSHSYNNIKDVALRFENTKNNALSIDDLRVQNSDDESDEEFKHVLDMLPYEDIPMILSPLSDISEENGGEHVNEPEVETTFASDDESIDNNFTHTIDSNTAQTSIEYSIKSYDQCIENDNESNKAFQDDAADVRCRGNREILGSITNNLMDSNEEYIDLNSNNLNDCNYTCTTENSYEDIYFGSLKNTDVEPNYIFENRSKENAIDLIIQCFDDSSNDLSTNLTENNGCNTFVRNQYSQNPHNTTQSKNIGYIPKCTSSTDLIGFLRESDIIDKINRTVIKTYSKCFVVTEKSVTKDSKSMNSPIQESVIENYPSCTNDSLECITAHNKHTYVENESFQSDNVLDCTRSVCINNFQSNLNNSQYSAKVPATKWNDEINITLIDQTSANNAVLISSLKQDPNDNNETNLISLESADKVVASYCKQVNNSVVQNESPIHTASTGTSAPLERELLKHSDTITSLNNEMRTAILPQSQHAIDTVSGGPIETINEIIIDEQQSNCCASEAARDNNSSCVTNKCHRETAQKVTVRNGRNRNMFNKMKAELFNDIIKYLNKKMKLNHMLSGKRQKQHSLHFKRMRRLQMLRWKQLREICPSSTDTDSDQSKKLRCANRRFKCKSQSEKETLDETNEQLKSNEEQLLEMSDEELLVREIIKEEINNQNLLASHKTLEEFYYMSNDGMKINESKSSLLNKDNLGGNINKEECYSADSGYVKSDSDESNSSKSCKRKRDENLDRSLQKKFVLTKYFDNEENCIKQNLDKNALNRKEGNILPDMNGRITNQNGTISAATCLNLNSTRFSKEIVTTEICSLLDRFESKIDDFEDDGITLPKQNCNSNSDVDCFYLFGSDCESISSEDERNSTTNSYLLKPKDPSSYTIKGKTKQRSNERSISKNNTTPSRKRTKSRICGSVCEKSEATSKTDSTSNVEDPLRARLWQDCLSSIVNVTKKSDATRTLYKRSNSLKNCQKLSKELAKPEEPCQMEFLSSIEKENTFHTDKPDEGFNHVLAISDKNDKVDEIKSLKKTYCIPEKPKLLNEEKARSLIKQLLTFPDKLSIVMETATTFATQDNSYIIRIILLEASSDTNKADTKYTPPAPVLTDTQRILLGFLVHLNRTMKPGVLDDFIMEAEKHIFTSTKLQNMENVTRLYLAICKLQRKIHRMRRMVCDVFYFMGDLSIPFLFTVLSTWIEVIPLESELNGELIIKVIIEIIKQKTCVSPGYNLVPLKCLLKAYYGYNMDENFLDDVFLEIFNKYKDTHSRMLEYAILLFCKNLKKDWVEQKIKQYFVPLIENTSDCILKENVLRIIKQTTQDHTFEGDDG